jgi:predicted RecB family nuclease
MHGAHACAARGVPLRHGMRLTAQDLYNYTKCAHRVYLDANGDPAEKSEVSSFVKLLWEMGLQKELEHLGTLAGTPIEDLKALSLQAAAERTDELMRAGAPLIYQGVLRINHLLGRPDLLVRRDDHDSSLGAFYYEAVDIKAGRGWEEREGSKPKFKRHYALQIMFYRDLLARVQGCAPPLGRIINIDSETEEFPCADFEADYASSLREVEKLVAANETSEPVLSSVCGQCEWYRKCRRWVEDTRDPTGLFFVGKQKFALKERGLATIDAIAQMDVKRYLKGPEKIPGLGEKSLERMKRRAQVMLAGKPEIRPGFVFPQAEEEIYFDIEDDPTQGLVYFYGMVLQDGNGRDEFMFLQADGPEEEENTVRLFWEFIRAHPRAVFYVYSHKERSTLRALMERYQLDPAVFEQYCGQELDLYKFVVDHSDWPTYSYGIKQIARQVGFSWRDPDPSGANSIAWYNDYLKDTSRKELMQRILEYNEDDCRAMIAIKRYFERNA